MAAKYLTKWRPGFAERLLKSADDEMEEKKENGVQAPPALAAIEA